MTSPAPNMSSAAAHHAKGRDSWRSVAIPGLRWGAFRIPLTVVLLWPVCPPVLAGDLAQTSPTEEPQERTSVHMLGVAPADTDTSTEQFLEVPGGVVDQVAELNRLVESICCAEHELGCETQYAFRVLDVDRRDLMSGVADLHLQFVGEQRYRIHHGNNLFPLMDFFDTLRLYGLAEGVLPVTYTRHPIHIDDEETFDPDKKVDRSDPSYRLLGRVLPGVSPKGGTVIALDYYATQRGLLMSARPMNIAALALAVAEHRANHFSFYGKRFTGSGGRRLFDYADGRITPNLSGCLALAVRKSQFFASEPD